MTEHSTSRESADWLRQVYFVITRRCNLACSHCIRSSDPFQRDALRLEDAVRVLEDLATFGRRAEVAITGGEPTLHGQFTEIVARAAKFYRSVSVNTNGLRARRLAEVLASHSNVRAQVSVDGDAAVHDGVRGPGTFERTLKALSRLSPFADRLVVASTVSRATVGSLPALDRALAPLAFSRWTIKREVVYGRASAANGLPTPAWNAAVGALGRFRNADRIEADGMFHPSTFDRSHLLGRRPPGPLSNCGTGRSKLYVNPDLTAFPCACLEDVALGDFRQESAATIVARMRALDVVPRDVAPCAACPLVGPCQGGCPGASLRVHGSFGLGDPRCPRVAHAT